MSRATLRVDRGELVVTIRMPATGESMREVTKMLGLVGVGLFDIKAAPVVRALAREIRVEENGTNGIGGRALSSAAVALLEQSPERTLHYSHIARRLIDHGVVIGGRDPQAKLLTALSRDDRVVKVARGYYALTRHGEDTA